MAPLFNLRHEHRRISMNEMEDALRLKRLQLDEEIESFKRAKEVEFQRYKDELEKEVDLDVETDCSHDNNHTSLTMRSQHPPNKSDVEVKAQEIPLIEKSSSPTNSATQPSHSFTSAHEETNHSASSGTVNSPNLPDAEGYAGPDARRRDSLAASADRGRVKLKRVMRLGWESSDHPLAMAKERTTNFTPVLESRRAEELGPQASRKDASAPVEQSSDLPQGSTRERTRDGLSEMSGQEHLQNKDARIRNSPHCINVAETEQALAQPEGAEKPQPETQSSVQDKDYPVRDSEVRQPSRGKEDRELELRALFTPAFLPLLEEPSHRHLLRDRNGDPVRASKHSRTISDTPKLSSSLTTLPLLSKSNEQSISTSVPRLGLGERRSSSSPTGTGRTLRSSLRSPDAANRGRKHVLFSIDNRVISPSTSPAATRTVSRKPQKGSRVPPIPISGLKDFPFPESGAPKPVSVPSRPSRILLRGTGNALPPSVNSPTSPHTRSYKDLVEPTVITPPEEIDQKDIAMEASNPLFDDQRGDDDLLARDDDFWSVGGRHREDNNQQSEKGDMLASNELNGSGRDIMTGGVGANEDVDADMAASPHASSLPIAIRSTSRPY